MPTINADRLLSDLKRLRDFGSIGNGTGVVRQSFSKIDIDSRHWLIERLQAAGLRASLDGVGNVIGRSGNGGKALLIGSHTDTQPTGGWLDGAMGVIYGLEVARALAEDPDTSDLPVDVASWIDEEGTFFGMLGSISFCDFLPDGAIDNCVGRDGVRLQDVMREAGVSDLPVARYDTERYLGYLEAHIEQGPYLEARQKRIGVVTSIIGMRDFDIDFVGEQNHAGTTPMRLRKDAGAALLDYCHQVRTCFPDLMGERTVFTIGQVTFEPGAPSIIPGKASMILQFRDPEESRLDRLQAIATELAEQMDREGPVSVSIKLRSNDVAAESMDVGFQNHLATAAEQHASGDWEHMPSGAAHDAQTLARRMPAGMLFVPSIKGVSHSFTEDTDEADIALGCQVLATATASILREANPR